MLSEHKRTKQYWESLNNFQLNPETFSQEIQIFSQFIADSNPEYHYNKTYLPLYVDSFQQFLDSFKKKYPSVKRMFRLIKQFEGVHLVIDRYWQADTAAEEEEPHNIYCQWSVYPLQKGNLVCDGELFLECSIVCETKRYLYHKKMSISQQELEEAITELEEFLNKYSKKRQ